MTDKEHLAATVRLVREVDAAIRERPRPAHELCVCDLCRRRRGCFVVRESDFDAPPGWCEVQRDDAPDFEPEQAYAFESDAEAAAWVSSGARVFLVDLKRLVPVGGLFLETEAAVSSRWRAIVPILDALSLGLLGEDACLVCGCDAEDPEHRCACLARLEGLGCAVEP